MRSARSQRQCYLAEWYCPEVSEQPVDDIATQLDAGVAMMRAEGTPVRLLATVAVPTDEVLYGLFAAQSPEIVEEVCQRAGIPADRLSAGVDAPMTLDAWVMSVRDEATDVPMD
jgi:hypothetical protein